MYKQVALFRFCSEECLLDHRKLARRKRAAKRRTGEVDSLAWETRKRIRSRDGNCCRWCLGRDRLHVHHIDYRSEQGPDEDWNLITLCEEHHAVVHSNKGLYKPLLKAYIWMLYVDKRSSTVPQIARWLGRGPRSLRGAS